MGAVVESVSGSRCFVPWQKCQAAHKLFECNVLQLPLFVRGLYCIQYTLLRAAKRPILGSLTSPARLPSALRATPTDSPQDHRAELVRRRWDSAESAIGPAQPASTLPGGSVPGRVRQPFRRDVQRETRSQRPYRGCQGVRSTKGRGARSLRNRLFGSTYPRRRNPGVEAPRRGPAT